MQVTMLYPKDIEHIKNYINNAKDLMRLIVEKTIDEGEKAGIYAPGFEYPASQASFAQMELDKILEIITAQ